MTGTIMRFHPLRWRHRSGVLFSDIEPPGAAIPSEAASCAESFNSRFRTECLDRELLYTLSESRVVFADWREYYNNIRPHRSLGLLTPLEFAAKETAPEPFETNLQGMGYALIPPKP